LQTCGPRRSSPRQSAIRIRVAVPTLTTVVAQTSQPAVALRPRAFVGVLGPGAEDYLQRMVSNDVEALAVGDACDALLLTPKARVIATLRIWRRGEDDFLLLTEPELGEAVVAELRKMRFAARCEIEAEQHTSTIVFGGEDGIPTNDYGGPAREVLDAGFEPTLAEAELERLRIEAGTPRYGHELDDRVLPAEAGLEGLLPRAGADCAPALPRSPQPTAPSLGGGGGRAGGRAHARR
jgi:folate-binding Fe-S cluster repair protein YgfZ